MLSIIIFAFLSGLLVWGFVHEAEFIRFEQMLFSKRGRRILKKHFAELIK